MKECFSFNRNWIRSRRWILIFHRVEKVESIFRSKKIFVENSFPRFWHFKPSRVQTDFSFKILVLDVNNNNNNNSSNNNNSGNDNDNDNNSSSFGCCSNLWNGIPVETKPKNRRNLWRMNQVWQKETYEVFSVIIGDNCSRDSGTIVTFSGTFVTFSVTVFFYNEVSKLSSRPCHRIFGQRLEFRFRAEAVRSSFDRFETGFVLKRPRLHEQWATSRYSKQ